MSDLPAPSSEAAARPSAKMENLIDEALSIVEEFSSEPGMELYFKHCREYFVVRDVFIHLTILTQIEKILIDILSPLSRQMALSS